MSTAPELVWAKVKAAAQSFSADGGVPTLPEAERIVLAFMSEVHCDPGPGREALEFFAAELLRLTGEYASSSGADPLNAVSDRACGS